MYKIITSLYSEEFGNFQKALIANKDGFIGLDVETTGLNPLTATWLLLQVALQDEQFIFNVLNLSKKDITYICNLIESAEDQIIVGFNLKFDLEFVKQNTGVLLTHLWDVQIAEILSENGVAENNYPSLEFVAARYLSVDLNKEVRETFYKDFNGIITEQQYLYAAEDVKYLVSLMLVLKDKLISQKQLQVLELENKVIPVVVSQELTGIKLDTIKWMQNVKELEEEAKDLNIELVDELVKAVFDSKKFENCYEAVSFLHTHNAAELKKKSFRNTMEMITDLELIQTHVKENINVGSWMQLLVIFRDILEMRDWQGKLISSTNEKVINKLAPKYPLIDKLLLFREKKKLASTYGESFLKAVNEQTGRLHAKFNQTGTQSGRFSSNEPNLLNIPKNNKYRNCFIAEDDYVMVVVDFSQEELRLMANISGDSKMIQAFREGVDFHTRTAANLYDIRDEDVTEDQRAKGKGINFTVGYDGTASALYRNFGIPFVEGEELINKFYTVAYPELGSFKSLLSEAIWKNGYSKTPFGRRRYFDKKVIFEGGANEADWYKAKTLRELGNHTMGQGPGADILKMCLVRLFFENPFGEEDFKIVLHIYDEIVVEARKKIALDAKNFIEKIMVEEESKFLGDVPAVVETALDENGNLPIYWMK